MDHHYLDRGLVLYSSLRETHANAELHVLALSEEAAAFLERLELPGLHVLRLDVLLEVEPRLKSARIDRTNAEFAFTLTPFLAREALRSCKPGEWTIYIDADMMFFGSTLEVVDSATSADVMVSPHNFSSHMAAQQRFGTYNTGFTGFRKTADGERCVQWWTARCLEWCYDRVENGKFADQKYIEQFAQIAPNTLSIEQIGVNCAPWNVSERKLSRKGNRVFIDDKPLILYHFSKVKRVTHYCIATRAKLQGVIGASGLNRFVYQPYARALEETTRQFNLPLEWTMGRPNPRHGAKYRGFEKDEQPSALKTTHRILLGEYVVSGWTQFPNLLRESFLRAPALPLGKDSNLGVNRPLKALSLPKIVLVTPSYNQGKWLPVCLKSIEDQKYPCLEHIVMDGGSTDGSLEILTQFSGHLHAQRSGNDKGQYDAINSGFILSDGEIMGWLNSDDIHFSWTLSLVSEIFAAFPQIRWLTTCYPIVVDADGRPRDCRETRGYSRHSILRGETLPGSEGFILGGIQQESTFWRRDLWEQVGGRLDTEFDYAADFDLWMRFAKCAEIYSVAVPIAAFRRHGNQKTSNDMARYCSQARESFHRHGRGFSSRRLRTIARQVVPEAFKPLAAKFGLLYPAKIVKRLKNTGEWAIQEIFA